MTRTSRIAAILALTLSTSACGTAQDFYAEKTRPTAHYDVVEPNAASRAEPFVNRMRTPVPDTAWARESSSECEPWTAPPGRCR